ncbi:hypothetical protein TSAR_007577 [Trichomalopsis sarcophagae]|uniref:Uncharacterized protein n=1 Tax=Trichomalopsis sarcophagae TaxID=543379 RepID=A0A232ESH5_9HYME|nr:hypothetical protein TSAR_007577 [Trichomalopsis sarcophagae]
MWEKIRDRLDSVDNVVSNASNIHKSVGSDLSAIMIQRTRGAEKKESLGWKLSKEKMLPNQQHIHTADKASQTTET